MYILYTCCIACSSTNLPVSVSAGFFADELHCQTEIADDAGKVVPNENILALEVSVCDGGFLGDTVDYPLVMEVSQTYIQLQW